VQSEEGVEACSALKGLVARTTNGLQYGSFAPPVRTENAEECLARSACPTLHEHLKDEVRAHTARSQAMTDSALWSALHRHQCTYTLLCIMLKRMCDVRADLSTLEQQERVSACMASALPALHDLSLTPSMPHVYQHGLTAWVWERVSTVMACSGTRTARKAAAQLLHHSAVGPPGPEFRQVYILEMLQRGASRVMHSAPTPIARCIAARAFLLFASKALNTARCMQRYSVEAPLLLDTMQVHAACFPGGAGPEGISDSALRDVAKQLDLPGDDWKYHAAFLSVLPHCVQEVHSMLQAVTVTATGALQDEETDDTVPACAVFPHYTESALDAPPADDVSVAGDASQQCGALSSLEVLLRRMAGCTLALQAQGQDVTDHQAFLLRIITRAAPKSCRSSSDTASTCCSAVPLHTVLQGSTGYTDNSAEQGLLVQECTHAALVRALHSSTVPRVDPEATGQGTRVEGAADDGPADDGPAELSTVPLERQ